MNRMMNARLAKIIRYNRPLRTSRKIPKTMDGKLEARYHSQNK